MMDRKLSAEEWQAELRAIIKKYREAASTGPVSAKAAKDEALAACRALGLSEGEAERYLASKGKP